MKLTLEQVEHIAQLARLTLDDDEKALYQEQLSAILSYFERLEELDTDPISPTASVLPLRNVMREDVARDPAASEDILANAPAEDEGCFEVPAVLD